MMLPSRARARGRGYLLQGERAAQETKYWKHDRSTKCGAFPFHTVISFLLLTSVFNS